jgi:hypothetical protein
MLLEALRPGLHPGSVAAILSDKRQKTSHEDYQRIERLSIGKRQAVFWRLKKAPPAG